MIKWEPDVYTSLDELPDEMPQSLKDDIAAKMKDNQGKIPKVWA